MREKWGKKSKRKKIWKNCKNQGGNQKKIKKKGKKKQKRVEDNFCIKI